MSLALSIIILSTVIALGKFLGRCKIFGVSLGVSWILFVGIIFSHFGFNLDPSLLHFIKELGLIFFVYSIGMQVGPSFFSSFRSGGIKLNLLAIMVVLLGVGTTATLAKLTGIDGPTMVGIMSGAVTNTPGLGAAQQAYADSTGGDPSSIALGYAVSYPLGVVGAILSFILLKNLLYKKEKNLPISKTAEPVDRKLEKIEQEARSKGLKYVHKKIIISKRKLNGKRLGSLEFEKFMGASITRIRRAGIEITAHSDTILQLGDVVTVVGAEDAVAAMEKILGNSLKKLDEPNLIAIFAGIAAGCALGSIPIHFPGIPQPIKLGLAGGPLIVSILISYFGPRFKVVTYTTTSANLMIREIGISLFLACVGLEAGTGFVDTILHKGGLLWIAYGAIITVLPLLLSALIGQFLMKLKCNTLLGVLSGACTNPPAIAFASEMDSESDEAAVAYATVYPLSMFLRVICAQLMVLLMV
ncbi:MAG: TrkA C-terminal domain-containing protein [Candidatus Cryptobacteroides sp.]